MKTPYDPTRGIDLYLDASGEDDWHVGTSRYYLVGVMACAPSDEWVNWMELHKVQYDGMVHWSKGRFGKRNGKLPNTKAMCRELLGTHPWFHAGIYVFDKEAFTRRVFGKFGQAVSKRDIVKGIWEILAATYLEMLILRVKKAVAHDPWGCLSIRQVIINNPKGGDKRAIAKVFTEKFGRQPLFVPAGHFGIDALDGVLWAFQRYFNLGKMDCLPASANDFNMDLNVSVLGVKSENLKSIRNAVDVEAFRDQR